MIDINSTDLEAEFNRIIEQALEQVQVEMQNLASTLMQEMHASEAENPFTGFLSSPDNKIQTDNLRDIFSYGAGGVIAATVLSSQRGWRNTSRSVLRRVGTKAGQELGRYLFDADYTGTRYSHGQLAERLFSELLNGRRNT